MDTFAVTIIFALLFHQLISKAECNQPCWIKPCACCRTGECINSGEKIYCTDCIAGLTGDTCKEPCPPNCVNCSQMFFPSNRTCFSCKNGYYNGRPYDVLEYPVQNDCSLSCKKGCAVCESYQTCSKCKVHFYMNSTNACSECPTNCANCSSATNCSICNDGYFKSGEDCEQCQPYCKRCDSYVSCQECDHGFYLEEKYCKRCNEFNYTNEACFDELVPPDRPSSFTSKADTGLIVGLVIGSIVIISVCIIVVIIVRRRCYKSSGRTQVPKRIPVENEYENTELLPREIRRTTETRDLQSAEKLTVLQIQGTFGAIEQTYGDLKINIIRNNITIEGDPVDIENAFKEINIECEKIQQVQYQLVNKSKEWVQFSKHKKTVEYVQKKLEQKHLLGSWSIKVPVVSIYVPDERYSEEIKNTLLESILEESVPVDKDLLISEQWKCFYQNISRTFRDKLKILTEKQKNLVIIGTDDVVEQVTQLVKEFFNGITEVIQCEPVFLEFVSRYWTQDDFDDICNNGVNIKREANGYELRGRLGDVIKTKDELNKKLNDINNEKHILKGTGIVTVMEALKHSWTINEIEKDSRCLIKLPQENDKRPSVMLWDDKVIDLDILKENQQNSSASASPKCFQTRRHQIKIQLVQGDIGHQKADIIVGAVSNLHLPNGSAFFSSLKQCGPRLQTEYNRLYPNGIQDGEVAVIHSGDFICGKIYLTSLPPWEAGCNGGKVLRNFLRECLRLADKYDKNTIAFSSSVTGGYLGYPMDMAVSIMYGAVVEFDSIYSNTSLNEIKIVIDNEDDETIKTYERLYKTQGRETRTKRNFLEDGTLLTKLYQESNYRMVKDGCAIGPIQLQVQVGNLHDYGADVIVMGVVANTDTKEKDTVVIQESSGLKAKYVIHVQFQDTLASWRTKLVDCLEEAGKKDIHSVALPVFQTGVEPQTFSTDGIGGCLFAAIDDFTSQNPKSSVRDVRLVVSESNAGSIPAIIAALQARTTAVNCQWGICKIFKSQHGFDAESRIFKESSITVYSDSPINIDRCVKALRDMTSLEFAKKVVDMEVINSLKDPQIISIIDSDIVVDVMFDKQAGQITINGPLRNVVAAVTCLHNKMLQLAMEENTRQSAEVFYNQTRWHWLYVNQMASEKWVPYDMRTNLYIERAYKAGTQTVELQSKDGKIYVIDFQKLIEFPEMDIYDTVMVIRKDIIIPGFFKGLQFDVKNWLSKSWTAMNSNENVIRVALDYGKEYQNVEKLFLEKKKNGRGSSKDNSRSVQVIKIERIQNKTLYKQYKTKKYAMKQQKPGCKQTEHRLWHECAEERILWIINNGFNRSYCGVHELVYGQGVYFAADASYSAQRYLAENKPGAKRYMFLAKVLTGELIKGDPSMRGLPLVDPARPNIMYDSAVDDVDEPMQFVIFHDKQAYPEYLITYTS